MISAAHIAMAERLIPALVARGFTVATAESCTGGLVAGCLTAIAGASAVVDRGFVTYSNAAKSEMLGVDAALIERVGAVSKDVAHAMAEGARARGGTTLAVSITGIAGPGGGSAHKPVGLVFLGCAFAGKPTRVIERRYGALSRDAIRAAAIGDALGLLEGALG